MASCRACTFSASNRTLSIDSDGVGRVERFIVLQWKYLLNLAADEQPPGRPNLHHLKTVAFQQAQDVLFEELNLGVGKLCFGE